MTGLALEHYNVCQAMKHGSRFFIAYKVITAVITNILQYIVVVLCSAMYWTYRIWYRYIFAFSLYIDVVATDLRKCNLISSSVINI